MDSAIATPSLSPTVVPTGSPAAAPKLANVLYEKKGAVAYVTVNRPKVLNALNMSAWADLRTAFEDTRDDATVRGANGSGPRPPGAGYNRRCQKLSRKKCRTDRPQWLGSGEGSLRDSWRRRAR